MTALLLLLCAIVLIPFAVFAALRAWLGPSFLTRLGMGVQQFEGIKPVWNFDIEAELSKERFGPEALVGQEARATEAFTCEGDSWQGSVRVQGELWRCQSPAPVHEGASVLIQEVRGLSLVVCLAAPAA